MKLKNCVYRFIDRKNKILYVGKAKNLQNRIKNNYHTSGHLPNECYDQNVLVEYIKLYNENDMDFAEKYYIQKYKPAYNTFYQNKPITISVPYLDKKTWSPFYVNKNIAEKQLCDFGNNLSGETFKFITIKINADLFQYLTYLTLKEDDCFKERELYQSFLKSGGSLNSNHAMWYKNIIKQHQENVNLAKLDDMINYKNKIFNEINKNLELMFKEYPLLSYSLIPRPEKSSLMYHGNVISIPDLLSSFDFKNNRFLMTLYVFCKSDVSFNINKSNMINCTLYVECT